MVSLFMYSDVGCLLDVIVFMVSVGRRETIAVEYIDFKIMLNYM